VLLLDRSQSAGCVIGTTWGQINHYFVSIHHLLMDCL
jgi:hypothetical protein